MENENAVNQERPSGPSSKYVLVLRTCNPDMTSRGGFKWPERGRVECSDWDATPQCGNGLHGLLWGEGDGSALNWDADAKWLVVKVESKVVVQFAGKVKFPHGEVVYCGDRKAATDYLLEHGAAGRPVCGAYPTAGDCGTATAGICGTATAGYRGSATAGYRGTATAGVEGTATAGICGTATAGDCGTATAGYRGTATAGVEGTAIAGDYGKATTGDYGSATAGYRGTATAGYRGSAIAGDYGKATTGDYGKATTGDYGSATAGKRGTATAGYRGTATAGYRGSAIAGDYGIIQIRYWDADRARYRVSTGYVGEGGIKPNTHYQLDDDGSFREVQCQRQS